MNRSIGGLVLTAISTVTLAMSSSSVRPIPTAESFPHPSGLLSEMPSHNLNTTQGKSTHLIPGIAESPEDDLNREIEEFLGKKVGSLCGGIAIPMGQHVDILIATMPDPVETHLSLFFDRTMDALQQALIREGYLFAGATLPWDSKQHTESSDWRIRRGQLGFENSREETPGLLIYRKPASPDGTVASPLFVLIVGETPTTGIHKDQFLKALDYFNCWSGDPQGKIPKRLRILGPTFSGSLYSMLELLNENDVLRTYDLYLHSGTVTGRQPAEDFQKELDRRKFTNVHFVSFQENDQYALQQFLLYVRTLGYLNQKRAEKPGTGNQQKPAELPRIRSVVLLTEDETAYGNTGQEIRLAIELQGKDLPDRLLVTQLSFPRDISHLRSAYQQDLLKSEASADKRLPRTSLPLDLDDIGGDKDTIPSYALRQTPLSQESVLFGVVTHLKKLGPDFVVIRATNPLDELFLARFLRKAYPQVRVVTIGADLLFQQQRDDALLQGILAIAPYSLRPDADRYLPPIKAAQSEHINVLTFPSTFSAGVYNATLSLLACEGALSPKQCPDAPAAPYHEYGWSRELPVNSSPESAYDVARPQLWLLVLGHDGYWPLARLNESALKPDEAGAAGRTLPETKREVEPKYSFVHHLTKDWTRFGTIFALAALAFCLLCSIGSAESASHLISSFDKTPDQHRAALLSFAATLLVTGICGTFLPYLLVPRFDSYFLYLVFFFALVPLVWYTRRTLVERDARGEAMLFTGVCLFILLSLLFLVVPTPSYVDHLELFRMEHVLSGVSPAVPVYLVLAALFWWCGSALSGQAFLGYRCPQLPLRSKIEDLKSFLPGFPVVDVTAEGCQKLIGILHSPCSGLLGFLRLLLSLIFQKLRTDLPIREKLRSIWSEAQPHTGDLWITARIALPIAFLLFLTLRLLDFQHPIYSLEGMIFDRSYVYLFSFAIFLLLTDLSRLVVGWLELRRLLRALEQLPLRRGFTDIREFSWRPIWRLGAVPQRVLAREWEGWRKYCLSQKQTEFDDPGANIKDQYTFLAERSADVLNFLPGKWAADAGLPPKKDLPKSSPSQKDNTENHDDTESPCDVRPAERFVCFVYLNFILTVLLRLRLFALSAAGMYVLLVLSLTSYPFEPRLGIRSFLILLLLAILAVVAGVYAQVHRDPTLSRITNTNAGELGSDFWLRIASFSALPVLGLLASQFPEIGRFLFAWLQPALDALTK